MTPVATWAGRLRALLAPRRWRPVSRTGRRGERAAARHLRRRGYRVLARNRRTPVGEADLVCLAPDRRTLVVVEVKARVGADGPPPEAGITAHKRRKLIQVARSLDKRAGAGQRPVRIDVVAIELDAHGRVVACRHHPGAVTEPGRGRRGRARA